MYFSFRKVLFLFRYCIWLPFIFVEAQIDILLYGDLEVCGSTSGKEILIYFAEGDAFIDIDAVLLQLCLLFDEHSHELPEEFMHDFHAPFSSGEVIDGMPHCEENSLDFFHVRRVVHR